ncbi:MAG: substrate-binding domain-containing protein [Anaerovoracaceae bacterium]
MKKLLVIVLALVLALGTFALTGCGGGDSDKTTIGFSSPSLNDTGQTIVVEGAQAFADENGFTLDVQDATEDVAKQQDQVKAMIESGVKALIVVPVDTAAAQPITDAAAEAGIPLVYVNRNPFGDKDPSKDAYFVGSPEIEAGMMQADFLKEKITKGGVAILQGQLTNEGAVLRTEGNEKNLKGSGIKVLAKEAGDWQRDKGLTLTENFITTYGDKLNAILANNDEMALGAIEAIKAAKRTDIIVIGVDAIADALASIQAGELAGTVLQDMKAQGSTGAEIAFKAVNGESSEGKTMIPFVMVTPDNVADFVK